MQFLDRVRGAECGFPVSAANVSHDVSAVLRLKEPQTERQRKLSATESSCRARRWTSESRSRLAEFRTGAPQGTTS